MSYNDPNQFGKGKGKNKKTGNQTEDTLATASSGQYLGQGESTEAEPWKQQLQNISLDDEKSETGSSHSDFSSSQKDKETDSYGSSLKDKETESFRSESSEESIQRGKTSDSYQGGKAEKKNKKADRKEESGEEELPEGAGYEEENEEESGEKRSGRFAKLGKQTVKNLGEAFENIDKTQLAKYAALGVLVLMGMRKNSFLTGLAVTVAAGILSKSLLENSGAGEEEEEETEEEGTEAVPA